MLEVALFRHTALGPLLIGRSRDRSAIEAVVSHLLAEAEQQAADFDDDPTLASAARKQTQRLAAFLVGTGSSGAQSTKEHGVDQVRPIQGQAPGLPADHAQPASLGQRQRETRGGGPVDQS